MCLLSVVYSYHNYAVLFQNNNGWGGLILNDVCIFGVTNQSIEFMIIYE